MGRGNLTALVILAFLILFFPLVVTSPYYIRVINFAGIFSIICIGLSLLMGYAGQISIGQAGFFAIGAYTSAILTVHFGCNIWLAAFVGVIINALTAFIVGIPTLKLHGHYLAMATLGIGEIIHITARADMEDLTALIYALGVRIGLNAESLSSVLKPFEALTGGPSGIPGIPTLGIGGMTLNTPSQWFYLIWSVVLILMILSLNLIHSRIGRALRAIHGNEEAARAMGINASRLKVWTFVISSVTASVAGSIYAHYVKFISPDTFSINESIFYLVIVSVGGMMNVWGAVIGSITMTILPETLRAFHDYDILMYGIVLLAIMMFMPEGMVGLGQRVFRSVRSKVRM